MTSRAHEAARNKWVARLKRRVIDVYYRTDWATVTILTVVAALTIGMYFLVVAIGDYRMNR